MPASQPQHTGQYAEQRRRDPAPPQLANPPGNANTPNQTPIYVPNPNPPAAPAGGPAPTGGLPINYFYVIANPPGSTASGYENSPLTPMNPVPQYPAVTQTLQSAYDPMPIATTTYTTNP